MSSAFRISALAALALLAALPAAAREFKVCAEPNNLPFSDRAGAGFENKIARLLASALDAELVLVPIAQSGPGFLRQTLGRGRCDALMAMPLGADAVALTAPYYRASWVFVARADLQPAISSFDDPRLSHLTIGVPVVGKGPDTPPVIALGRRGLIDQLRRYPVGGDLSHDKSTAERMVADVAAGRVDLAVMWGPAAGYFARRQAMALGLTPTPTQDGAIPFTTAIAVAVAKGNRGLRDKLDAALRQRQTEIDAVLARYAVPREKP